jgi:hypothetical protein
MSFNQTLQAGPLHSLPHFHLRNADIMLHKQDIINRFSTLFLEYDYQLIFKIIQAKLHANLLHIHMAQVSSRIQLS